MLVNALAARRSWFCGWCLASAFPASRRLPYRIALGEPRRVRLGEGVRL